MTNRFDPGEALDFSPQAALARELPTQFVAEEIDFAKPPWLGVTYAYRLQPLVSLAVLPEPMRQELLCGFTRCMPAGSGWTRGGFKHW